MIYYTDKNSVVFAYNEDDLIHDNNVRASISQLNEKKDQGLVNDGKIIIDDAEYVFSDVISTLEGQIRISDSLTQITKDEADEILSSFQAGFYAEVEHAWVKSELENAQVELMYFWTNDTARQKSTEEKWKQYAIDLRNYTTTDSDGNISVSGQSRPQKPQ